MAPSTKTLYSIFRGREAYEEFYYTPSPSVLSLQNHWFTTLLQKREKRSFQRQPPVCGQRKQPVKDQMEDVFKDNRLRNQVSTPASTFACTSDQFISSRRSEDTDRLFTPAEGPQLRNTTSSDTQQQTFTLSGVYLTPATFSYIVNACSTAIMSKR